MLNNIPAFPQNTKIVLGAGQEIHQGFMGGMTLRDYFAAKAMQGYTHYLAANSKFIFANSDLAKEAYSIADAMLEARNAAQ